MSIRMSDEDRESADNCKLPKLIPDICDRCRDYKYCHRQLTLTDLVTRFGGWDEIVDYYIEPRNPQKSTKKEGANERTNRPADRASACDEAYRH